MKRQTINFKQFRNARARINDGTVDRQSAIKAIGRYRWAEKYGWRRPFLHGYNGRKICPLTAEVIALLEIKFNLKSEKVEPSSPRQDVRYNRSFYGIMAQSEIAEQRNKAAEVERRRLAAEVAAQQREQRIREMKEAALRIVRGLYGDTALLFIKVGGTTHALVYFDGEKRTPEAFLLDRSGCARRNSNSKSKRYTPSELAKKHWKTDRLNSFQAIMELLAEEHVRMMAIPASATRVAA